MFQKNLNFPVFPMNLKNLNFLKSLSFLTILKSLNFLKCPEFQKFL